jgi:hypothetical protein
MASFLRCWRISEPMSGSKAFSPIRDSDRFSISRLVEAESDNVASVTVNNNNNSRIESIGVRVKCDDLLGVEEERATAQVVARDKSKRSEKSICSVYQR